MSDKLDQAAKLAGLIGVGLYAVGFAVVSIHDGTYGFIPFSAFRAKIIAAGLMFAVLYFPALLGGARVYGRFGLPPKTTLRDDEGSLKRFASGRLYRLSELALAAWTLAYFFQFLVVGYKFRYVTFAVYLGYIAVRSLPNVWTQARLEKRPGLFLSTVFLPDLAGIGVVVYLKWYSLLVFLGWFIAGLDAQDLSDLFEKKIVLREYNWHF